jgi:hypothetical protein
MTAPVVALPLSTSDGSSAKKKRVLLLDTSQTKRDLRADVMRQLGIEVDCAADVLEARCWWRADLYNLVLINVAGEIESRDKFCTDMRSAIPPQKIAFFVGGPEYLAVAPHSDEAPAEPGVDALHREMHCWPRPRAVHRSAGESSKRAERFPACARSAKLVRARYGKPPDRPDGQKQSSNILRARPRRHNRYLKAQHLYRKQRESSYEESLRRQLTPQHHGTGTSRLV